MSNSSGESAAREQVVLAKALAEACARFDGTTLSSWRDYTDDTLLPLIASHYAARAREVQELVKAVEEDTRQIDRTHRLQLALAPFAAKGETDRVAAQGEQQ